MENSLGHTKAAPVAWTRAVTVISVALTGLFLAMLAADWIAALPRFAEIPWGADYTTYMEATRRWLAGEPGYHPYQLAGPYAVSIENAPILYPPTMFVILAAFMPLPGPLWVLAPAIIVAAVIAWHRPTPIAWPAIAAALWFPTTSHMIVTGNPGLWVVAALALGTVRGGWAVGVLLKPSLAPFALWGANRKWWWITLGVSAALSVMMLTQWLDYLHVLANARGPITYSIDQVPVMFLPIAAWLGSSRRAAMRGRAAPTP